MVAEATPTNSISISYASSGHERATQREGFHIKCTTGHFRKKKKRVNFQQPVMETCVVSKQFPY